MRCDRAGVQITRSISTAVLLPLANIPAGSVRSVLGSTPNSTCWAIVGQDGRGPAGLLCRPYLGAPT